MFVFFSKNNNNKKSVSKAGSLLCPWKKLVMINSLHHQITDFIRATRGHTTFPIFFFAEEPSLGHLRYSTNRRQIVMTPFANFGVKKKYGNREKKEKSQDFFWLDFETWTISPKIIKTINFTFPKNQAFLTKDTVVKDGSEHNCKCSSSRAWSSCPLRRTRNSTSRHLAKWPQGSPASDTPWPVSSQLRNHLFFKNSNYHEICITPKNSSATKKICKHIWYVFCSFCHPSSMKKVLLGPFTPHLAASFSPYCSQSLVFLKFFKGPKIRKKKTRAWASQRKDFWGCFSSQKWSGNDLCNSGVPFAVPQSRNMD